MSMQLLLGRHAGSLCCPQARGEPQPCRTPLRGAALSPPHPAYAGVPAPGPSALQALGDREALLNICWQTSAGCNPK